MKKEAGSEHAEHATEGGGGGGEAQDIHSVVAEHGPAHKVNITHDHAANKHSMQSHHEGGHVHESHHGTAEEAHEEGKAAAGIASTEEPEKEEAGAHGEAENPPGNMREMGQSMGI
jgi:hypothetical protein